jgi:pilus assembly protein CpaE
MSKALQLDTFGSKFSESDRSFDGNGANASGETTPGPVDHHAIGISAPEFYEGSKPLAPMIGVIGSKGGVGATTFSINLSVCLADIFNSTATLVDANLQQPDAAAMLGRQLRYTILDLVNKTGAVTPEMLAACCASLDGRDRSFLLSGPMTGEAALKTDLSSLWRCLETIRNYSEYWVIDLPRNIDEHLVKMLDECNLILIVFEATTTSVVGARRWLQVFRDLGYDTNNLLFILSRAGSKEKLLLEGELDELMSDCRLMRVPNAFRLCQEAAIQSMPAYLVASKNAYVTAMKEVATIVNKLARQGVMHGKH